MPASPTGWSAAQTVGPRKTGPTPADAARATCGSSDRSRMPMIAAEAPASRPSDPAILDPLPTMRGAAMRLRRAPIHAACWRSPPSSAATGQPRRNSPATTHDRRARVVQSEPFARRKAHDHRNHERNVGRSFPRRCSKPGIPLAAVRRSEALKDQPRIIESLRIKVFTLNPKIDPTRVDPHPPRTVPVAVDLE